MLPKSYKMPRKVPGHNYHTRHASTEYGQGWTLDRTGLKNGEKPGKDRKGKERKGEERNEKERKGKEKKGKKGKERKG